MPETLTSDLITAFEGSDKVSVRQHGGKERSATARVTTTQTTGSNASVLAMARVPTECWFQSIKVLSNGAAIPNFRVGVRHAEDTSLFNTGSVRTGLALTAGGEVEVFDASVANPYRDAWSFTSATTNPGGYVDLIMTFEADATAAGTVEMKVTYLVD